MLRHGLDHFDVQPRPGRRQEGPGRLAHPFYQWAKDALGEAGEPKWNFHKLLIGKDGSLVDAFGSRTEPQDPAVTTAIEAAL